MIPFIKVGIIGGAGYTGGELLRGQVAQGQQALSSVQDACQLQGRKSLIRNS